VAWISVHQQLRDHRKLRDLYRRLNTTRQQAIGYLILLWLWGLDNADPKGLLLSTTIEDIEEALYWTGELGKLYQILVQSGWIDELEDGIYLHDWEDFNKPFYQYIDRKNKDKFRKRNKNSAGNSAGNSARIPQEIPQEFRNSPSPSPSPNNKVNILNNPSISPLKLAEYVTMTNDEYQKLLATYGKEMTDRLIEVLDNYKGANGKKYKSDYRAILNWVVKRVQEEGFKLYKPRAPDEDPVLKNAREAEERRQRDGTTPQPGG
jgi:hypothetical protein